MSLITPNKGKRFLLPSSSFHEPSSKVARYFNYYEALFNEKEYRDILSTILEYLPYGDRVNLCFVGRNVPRTHIITPKDVTHYWTFINASIENPLLTRRPDFFGTFFKDPKKTLMITNFLIWIKDNMPNYIYSQRMESWLARSGSTYALDIYLSLPSQRKDKNSLLFYHAAKSGNLETVKYVLNYNRMTRFFSSRISIEESLRGAFPHIEIIEYLLKDCNGKKFIVNNHNYIAWLITNFLQSRLINQPGLQMYLTLYYDRHRL